MGIGRILSAPMDSGATGGRGVRGVFRLASGRGRRGFPSTREGADFEGRRNSFNNRLETKCPFMARGINEKGEGNGTEITEDPFDPSKKQDPSSESRSLDRGSVHI